MIGPCAKARVFCKIIGERGETYVGENACDNPQVVCPREEGEDYTKCETICQQQGHAEIQALKAAGDDAKRGIAILYGHTYFCAHCQHALFDAGVSLIGVAGGPVSDRRP